MDAAATHANTLLSRYCTENGKFETRIMVDGPEPVQLAEGSGLSLSNWEGERVFCNPPYDHELENWINLAVQGWQERVVPLSMLLLPPSTDTEWFHNLWPDPPAKIVKTITHQDYHGLIFDGDREMWFMKKRMKFGLPRRRILGGMSYDYTELSPQELKDAIPDESNSETVKGPAPRAGNIVAVFRC